MRVASFVGRMAGCCAIVLALTASSCDDGLLPPDRERVVGTISFYQDPVKVEVPKTATRGTPFDVKVTTYGGGCISQGDTEVEVQGAGAVVTPYDVEVRDPELVCTLELRTFVHVASVRFDAPGPAVVTVRGVREPEGDVVTVQKTVTVQ